MVNFQTALLLYRRLIQIFKPRLIYSLGCIFCIALTGFALFPQTTLWLDNLFFDFKQTTASYFRSPDPSLVVIGIDMKTLSASTKRWPWPREDVAAVIQKLSQAKPRGVLVDVLFQSTDTEPGDARLESVIKATGNIILISILEEKQSAQGTTLTRFTSLPRFGKASLAEGFVWGVPGHDGVIRSFRVADERLNAQSAAMATIKHFAPATDVHAIPDCPALIFARKNGGIPVISLQDIIENESSYADFLRDKILVLGVNARVVHDYHNTALGNVAGVEILAASVDTILSGRAERFFFSDRIFRAFAVTVGFLVSWVMLLANYSLLPVLLVFALILGATLIFTELLLWHLPIAPMVFSWALTSLTIATARYFNNLFSLQEMRLEAATASMVQEQLLPAMELAFNDYTAYGISRSASALGGDYFDYFVVRDRYLLVIIGDATGHGVPAALAMAIGKATVLMSLEKNLSPDELIEGMNATLFKSLKRKLMMTAALLWVDTATHEFEYRNCGHPYPYKLSDDGSVTQIAASGLFLGTKAAYRSGEPYKGILQPGERLLFYSDGLIESMPVTNDQDGYIAFNDYLLSRPKLPIREACHDILDQHPFFKGQQPQPDDFTALIVERRHQQP
ncbi:MAG TPA: CHASE2 domain-containing protein [Candidatus Rifleibacterium sp.]|nr:CHASE2 domain-containing protein [Candidatus Rifleibacterium sp.]HPT48239.1 CHASE2 domain-containing protein [Candidatus Rifleibacterium sp.]